jgi:benzodiazapine receptor
MTSFSRATQLAGLVFWLAVSFVAAGVGAYASANAGDFYQTLTSPPWAPPASIFGPVWTILYVMMGTAAWLVWRERGAGRAKTALILFCIQLIANALWTWLFFYFHLGLLATVDIGFLWFCILATIVAFKDINKVATILLLPYFAWVTFASVLCVTMWRLNPAIFG